MKDTEMLDSQSINSLIVLIAPSGGGKSTIIKELCRRIENIDFSISTTTRPPRPQEINGESYHFISEESFKKKINSDDFLEWEKVHGNYYGTGKENLQTSSEKKKIIVLDLDVAGAKNLKKMYPQTTCTIFLAPPSLEALRTRLVQRATDKPEVIEKRMQNAIQEMQCKNDFDHLVINQDLETAICEIIKIIKRDFPS